MQAIWEPIQKYTVEKSQTNATNVTLHPLIQAPCRDILRCMLENRLINADSVIENWKRVLESARPSPDIIFIIWYCITSTKYESFWWLTMYRADISSPLVAVVPIEWFGQMYVMWCDGGKWTANEILELLTANLPCNCKVDKDPRLTAMLSIASQIPRRKQQLCNPVGLPFVFSSKI